MFSVLRTSVRTPTSSSRTQAVHGKQASFVLPKRFASTDGQWKRTSLYPLHLELQGKMVEFAGWEMPIQYADQGIIASHMHTRQKASLFDVSHMQQLRFTGRNRNKFLELLVVGDISGLPANHARLSTYTNKDGGIIDDTVITNRGDHLYVVVNAGCADKDVAHISKHLTLAQALGFDVKLEKIDRSLIALQGPSAESVLAKLTKDDITSMPFMTCKETEVAGIKGCLVSRCGYTGEDGFEISVDHKNAVALAKAFLANSDVKPAGLGARDSLRLEAGLCLYGHDLNENITPVEANLSWCIGKSRREEDAVPFLGHQKVLPQLKGGVESKRVGFIVNGPPAREGATIHRKDNDEKIGFITSGTMSPVLKKSIAMGYVKSDFSKLGTEVNVKVRDKSHSATISKMPFVPHNYKK